MFTDNDDRIARAVLDDMTGAVPSYVSNRTQMRAAAWAFAAFAEEDRWSNDAQQCLSEILNASAAFHKGA